MVAPLLASMGATVVGRGAIRRKHTQQRPILGVRWLSILPLLLPLHDNPAAKPARIAICEAIVRQSVRKHTSKLMVHQNIASDPKFY